MRLVLVIALLGLPLIDSASLPAVLLWLAAYRLGVAQWCLDRSREAAGAP